MKVARNTYGPNVKHLSLPLAVCMSLCLSLCWSVCLCLSVHLSFCLSISQAEEPVLNALSACKMLQEMSKLESQTDTKLSMEKLAQKFKDKAEGETLYKK